MRLLIATITFCLLTGLTSIAQTISDSKFHWIKNESCLPQGVCLEIFVKVEQDPILTQFSKKDFDNLIRKTIQSLNLTEEQSGIMKLKLLFAKNQNMCITQIGTKSLELNELQINEITSTFNSINRFENGKQRNSEVNCQGILYINITKGQLDKTRNVNFKIELGMPIHNN